jgi:NifB/MoaA-like Fe-S oxidoreductase
MLTSNGRITAVLRALIIVVTDYWRVVACAVYVVAPALSACVAVIAVHALAKVLSADAVHTDARKAVVRADLAVSDLFARTVTTTAILPGAHVVVRWTHNTAAGVTVVPAEMVWSAPLCFLATTEVHAS